MTVVDAREEAMSEERLISADSHVAITHQQVRAHLARAFHPDYDEAVAVFTQRMARGTAAANQAGMTMKRTDGNTHIGANAVFKRPGYRDPRERLTDMDLDGVEVEVLYSEVSAFRYIPDLKTGAGEATAPSTTHWTSLPRLTVRGSASRIRYRSTTSISLLPKCSAPRSEEGSRSSCRSFRPSSGFPTTTTSDTTASFRPLRRRACRSAAISA